MRFYTRFFTFMMSFMLIVCVEAEPSPDTSEMLKSISQKITSQEKLLIESRTKELEAKKKYDAAAGNVVQIEKKKLELDQDLKDLQADQIKQNQAVEREEKKFQDLFQKYKLRMRAMYVRGNSFVLPYGIEIKDRASLPLFFRYVSKILMHDHAILLAVKDQLSRVESERAKKNQLLSEHAQLIEAVSRSAREAKDETKKLLLLKNRITEEKIQSDKRLKALKGEADKLSIMVAKLSEVKPPLEPPAAQDEKSEDAKLPLKGLKMEAQPLLNPMPKGEVIQSFGATTLAKFDDLLFSKGLEYRVSADTPVLAIARGNIVFTGQLPGYGLVAILDHGARDHTLYARLGSTRGKVGDQVARGAVIGRTSDPDKRGRSFYFEVRHNGKPVNPSAVLNVSKK